MALLISGVSVHLREIVLKDKAPEFVEISPKATVPVLVLDTMVLEESLDIMHWSLNQNDPENWLDVPEAAHQLIKQSDTQFKPALDRYKYSARFENEDGVEARQRGSEFITLLDDLLKETGHLYGSHTNIADIAIFPFVRQFAFVDKEWFDTQHWGNTKRWLDSIIVSPTFLDVMKKYPRWKVNNPITVFP